jgi:ribosome recycling factor
VTDFRDPGSLLQELGRRMDGALEALRREFAGLRTGRASAHLLDAVKVNAYGPRSARSTCRSRA